jgi:DNA-3-methyladenine glycosylase II
MSKFVIKPVAPFDFDLTLGVYGSFTTQAVDRYSPGSFERVLSTASKDYLVRAHSSGSLDAPEILVSIFPPAKEEASKALLTKLKWMIGAELDLTPFYECAEKEDPVLFQIVNQLRGLKPPRTPSIFEALVIAITEQQTSLVVASTIRGRLARRYGKRLFVQGQEYYGFPSPEALAEVKPEDVKRMGYSLRKARCIITVARKVARGEIDLESLKDLSMEEALEELTPIKGIGRWTVEYMMCRGMGRYDALPANDAGLKAAVSQFYKGGKKAEEKDVRTALDPLGEFKGLAAFYLIFAYALEKYGIDPRGLRKQAKLI